jgi:hypothetical protein
LSSFITYLAFTGLLFETPIHNYTPYLGKGITIKAGSSAIVFTKEIREGKINLKTDILVSQRYFDPKDRYNYSDKDPTIKVEKDLQEYIINKIYGCHVVVTNCSVSR